MMAAAYYYGQYADIRETVSVGGQKVHVSDGDSFAIGKRKLRLEDIDAPELHQNCTAANGASWPCGQEAKASLAKLLGTASLHCSAATTDQFGRSVATCSAKGISDIGGALVRQGMAVSHEYMTMRTYGDEEDEARDAKRGIWQGKFERPKDWRAANPR